MTDPLHLAGQTLNGYRIAEYRDEGAFSLVYEALHLPTNSVVAIKLLKPGASPLQTKEFQNEGDLLVKLSGATGVVNILDGQVGQLDASPTKRCDHDDPCSISCA